MLFLNAVCRAVVVVVVVVVANAISSDRSVPRGLWQYLGYSSEVLASTEDISQHRTSGNADRKAGCCALAHVGWPMGTDGFGV